MNNLKSGPISSSELMAGLAKAKKLINKVETGDFKKGYIDETQLVDENYTYSDSEEVLGEIKDNSDPELKTKFKVVGEQSTERIQNSKLPDVIKKAMMESPIPQISLNDTIDMDFVKKAKKLMEEEGTISKTTNRQVQSRQQSVIPMSNNSDLIPLIENIVRKTVTEILDRKLDQLLTAQKTMSINESLVLKVGDSIFKGKITGVNKAK